MTAAPAKMPVQCPHCARQLMVPTSAAGKQGRCPTCTTVFTLPALVAADFAEQPQLAPLSSDPFGQPAPLSDFQLQPLAQPDYGLQPLAAAPAYPQGDYSQGGFAQAPNPYTDAASTAPQAKDTNKYNHGFGLEHRAWDSGILGGLGMIAIAVVWFATGMFFNRFFIYPPILLIIGIVAFVRGLIRTASGAT